MSADLMTPVRELLPERAQRALDQLAPVTLRDAGAGRVHRSALAHAVMTTLFADLLDRVPSGRTYVRLQAAAGRRVVLDHGAVRTVAWPTASHVPPGIEQVTRVLEPLGWRHRETYPLRSISMTGTSWAHDDAPEEIAQWFVSEFHPDDFSPSFRHTVERVLASSTDPIDDGTRALLAELSAEHTIAATDAASFVATVASCFTRRHRMPTKVDHATLLAESAEMAWIATEGTAFNHATDRVPDVAATAEEERISGRPIKERIEVSSSGRVRQTAHRATKVERTFSADGEGEPVTATVPGSFFEFIDRATLPGSSDLDLGFDAANAQGIFAMTRATASETATDLADADLPIDEARSVSRPAFTFKVRRRHLSAKRQAEFDEWIHRWNVAMDGPPLDWNAVFDRPSDARRRNGLDIGFGHGESTIAMARAEPDLDVIGVEVHDPGVVAVLDAIENEPLRNLRVMHGDVIRFLRRIGADSLDVVRVFFPDPWKKARQHHRRLVRDDVVAALTDRLRTGGVLHLATDIADYAEQMQAACDAEPRLAGGVIPRPDSRPLTRFEQRGLDEGRAPVDLWYAKV